MYDTMSFGCCRVADALLSDSWKGVGNRTVTCAGSSGVAFGTSTMGELY